jgi:hypothetical protein
MHTLSPGPNNCGVDFTYVTTIDLKSVDNCTEKLFEESLVEFTKASGSTPVTIPHLASKPRVNLSPFFRADVEVGFPLLMHKDRVEAVSILRIFGLTVRTGEILALRASTSPPRFMASTGPPVCGVVLAHA